MIYFDHAATTKPDDEVIESMQPYLSTEYGNPSSIYRSAVIAKRAIAKARGAVASLIGADPAEIYFTSGGTEADNWAIQAAVHQYYMEWQDQKKDANGNDCGMRPAHVITSQIEHPAILRTCEFLESIGMAEVTYVSADPYGTISPQEVKAAIRKETCLISMMTANNELGTIQPIREIGKIAKKAGILFHTDAVQAFGHIPISIDEFGVDLLSASAHKLNGPKGVGCLYIRNGVKLPALLHGGAQERNRRAGTEAVAEIVGFGKAASIAKERMQERSGQTQEIRDMIEEQLKVRIPGIQVNGTNRLPGHLNLTIPGISAEALLIRLDMEGICASAGSACSSGSLEPSHVLSAIGKTKQETSETVRFSCGHENTIEEAKRLVQAVISAVDQTGK